MPFRRYVFEKTRRLALQGFANCFERREPHGAGLARLEDRQIGERDVNAIGELGERHPPGVEHVVEFHDDWHRYTVPSRSSRILDPCSKTRASTNNSRTASHLLIEKFQWMSRG